MIPSTSRTVATGTYRGLVIDDALLMRKLISTVLECAPDIEVAGIAPNGRIGLEKLSQLQPDFVTLDVEMPELGGLETLRLIRRRFPDLPVIMVSAATSRGASITLDALAAGASDYVTKPHGVGNLQESIQRLELDLIPKIRALCGRRKEVPAAPVAPRAMAPPRTEFGNPVRNVELLCIGTSTGGPNALAEIFSHLDRPLPVPVAIVQHMPPAFTQMLAERLGRSGGVVTCREAVEAEPLENGKAYMAPGGRHLGVVRRHGRLCAQLLDTPPENSCRPAVDVLFRTAVEAVGGGVLGIVLTGMGSDGMLGAREIVARGGRIIAQDEDSSVVWGMPGSVVRAGLADTVVSLGRVPGEIYRRLGL